MPYTFLYIRLRLEGIYRLLLSSIYLKKRTRTLQRSLFIYRATDINFFLQYIICYFHYECKLQRLFDYLLPTPKTVKKEVARAKQNLALTEAGGSPKGRK